MAEKVPPTLLDAFRRYKVFLIAGHKDPDGDSVGSQLALAHYLERRGKKARLYSPGPFNRPEIRSWEPLFNDTITPEDRSAPSTALVVVDCSSPDRIGELAEQAADLPVLVIDHHSSGVDFGDHRYIDSSSPSASLLIQKVIEALDDKPDLDEAEHLFFGFSTDTGFFRHLGHDQAESLELVSRLLANGASPRQTYQTINSGRTLASRKLLARILERSEAFFFGQLIFSYELASDRREFQVRDRDSDKLFDLLLNIDQCEVVCIIREEKENLFSLSLRSREWVNVGRLAAELDGGGHARAAGCSMKAESAEEVKAAFLPLLEKHLKNDLY